MPCEAQLEEHIPMVFYSVKEMRGCHKGCMETSNTNININIHILMLYADIDAVTNGNLLIGHFTISGYIKWP